MSFKVICIKEVRPELSTSPRPSSIVVGETYEVVDTEFFIRYNDTYYELASDLGRWYCQTCFALVSDIDETEMIREYQKQTV